MYFNLLTFEMQQEITWLKSAFISHFYFRSERIQILI